MKAIITVLGKDSTGIISSVSTILANSNINILDISQTILQEYFTMVMLVDLSNSNKSFKDLKNVLSIKEHELNLSINVQHEDIFNSMHNI